MNIVSLFAGVGGFERAFANCGAPTAASVEIDAAARGVLADRFPGATLMTDVTKVTGDDLRAAGFDPDTGVLTAGWPCQGNSVAGRRGGMDDPRSGLWSHVVRLLAETRPRWFFGENVPGLLSVNGGRDFGVVVEDLARLGYRFAWRVLDAQYFGVPQRRRRVFIVGHLGDGAAPVEVLLEPEGGGRDSAPSREAGAVVAALTRSGVGGGGGPDDNAGQAGHLIPHVADTLTSGSGGGRYDKQPVVAYALTAREGKGPDSDATTNLIAHTLTGEGHDASEDGTGRGTPLVPMGFHLTQDPISGDIVPAMGAKSTGNGVLHESAVRRLTPLECERLQGYPDGWTATSNGKPQSDSARYRQMGNSVAVPVVEWIARRIVTHDEAVRAA